MLIPSIVAYEKCNVEDAGSVETSATTGKYVGLRQGQGFPFELFVYSYDLFIFNQTFCLEHQRRLRSRRQDGLLE